MKKIFVIGGILVVVVLLGFLACQFFTPAKNTPQVISDGIIMNIHDATYTIDGQSIVLKNGISIIAAAPGSASKIETRYFGNDAQFDFNDDGVMDRVFLITQQSGGSGTFYYAVVLLRTEKGNLGSNAYFLGDRIAPQTTSVEQDGTILVNFADRKSNESFVVKPSVGKTARLKFNAQTMELTEVK